MKEEYWTMKIGILRTENADKFDRIKTWPEYGKSIQRIDDYMPIYGVDPIIQYKITNPITFLMLVTMFDSMILNAEHICIGEDGNKEIEQITEIGNFKAKI
jgi:hypothetical protein